VRRLRLSRRAVLRGAGVAVALPTLDAMLDDRGLLHKEAWAQAAPPPVRLVTFFLPNGFPVENRFVPREVGAGYTVTPCLDPIKAHVPGFTVLSNVQGRGGTCMHASGLTAFGTGLPHAKTGATGPSLDQVAARRNGMSTRFPSLVVGVQSAPIPGTNGNSSDIFLNVSWQDANQPSPADREPGPLFARLFGNGPQDDKAYALLRRNRRSVLDYLIAEVGRWKPRLGADDNARLDAHLGGLRELERRLPLETQAPAACAAPAMGNAAPAGYVAKAQLQCALFATALACRLTSYGCFIYGIGAGDGGPDPAYALSGNHHQETHANKQGRHAEVHERAHADLQAVPGPAEGDARGWADAAGQQLDHDGHRARQWDHALAQRPAVRDRGRRGRPAQDQRDACPVRHGAQDRAAAPDAAQIGGVR